MRISDLLETSYMLAFAKFPELHQNWVNASYAIGGKVPNSLMLMSVQRVGQLDLLLRGMEEERIADPKQNQVDFSLNYQLFFSQVWICQLYEILRTLKERQSAPDTDEFKALMRDLKLLRITFDKHELADDKVLKGEPAIMMKRPMSEGEEQNELYVYSKGDLKRGHIMASGMSARGSAMWEATDLLKKQSYRIERMALSERLLAIFCKSVALQPS